MKKDFEFDLLTFVIRDREGWQLLKHLDDKTFDSSMNQVILSNAQTYAEDYSTPPSKVETLIDFFRQQIARSKGEPPKKEVVDAVEDRMRRIYDHVILDREYLLDRMVLEAQRKLTKDFFKDNSKKVKDAQTEDIGAMVRQMSTISRLKEEVDIHNQKEIVSTNQLAIVNDKSKEVSPTYLYHLNQMTAVGGFHTPQLVILMGAPKSFKTGNLIKLCMEYVREGKKVYYVDCENGVNSIHRRAQMCKMESTMSELRDETEQLVQVQKSLDKFGGDMKIGWYPAHTNNVADVEADLERIRDDEGWEPDLIAWDYPDLMLANNRRITEKRLIIQAVYFDIIALNKRWNVFSVGLSQVSKNAVNKANIDMKDFAEDFGKAMNCHAAFAICRTEWEMQNGYARIIPVVQREGSPFRGLATTCLVKLEEDRMKIDEVLGEERDELFLDMEAGKLQVDPMEQKKGRKEAQPIQRRRRKKNTTDE